MKIAEFFDPYDPDHMRAYRDLCETGGWPEGFLPLGLDSEYDPAWQVKIVAKMADAWVDHMASELVRRDRHNKLEADILEDLKCGQTDRVETPHLGFSFRRPASRNLTDEGYD